MWSTGIDGLCGVSPVRLFISLYVFVYRYVFYRLLRVVSVFDCGSIEWNHFINPVKPTIPTSHSFNNMYIFLLILFLTCCSSLFCMNQSKVERWVTAFLNVLSKIIFSFHLHRSAATMFFVVNEVSFP